MAGGWGVCPWLSDPRVSLAHGGCLEKQSVVIFQGTMPNGQVPAGKGRPVLHNLKSASSCPGVTGGSFGHRWLRQDQTLQAQHKESAGATVIGCRDTRIQFQLPSVPCGHKPRSHHVLPPTVGCEWKGTSRTPESFLLVSPFQMWMNVPQGWLSVPMAASTLRDPLSVCATLAMS